VTHPNRTHITVGVLALQGAFDAHVQYLRAVGVTATEIRTPEELDVVDALVLPGGESGTMWQLLQSSGLFQPIASRLAGGMPAFGTCAGMILLASSVLDGRAGQTGFGAINIAVRRNAFGRQVDSFESEIHTEHGTFHGVFIRAPRIETVGDGVGVLGSLHHDAPSPYDEPVLVQQGRVLAASFHPELTGDHSLHEYFVSSVISA
jgi:5'-phosphate synthase pdxT subunit